jgi:hypothetical protein
MYIREYLKYIYNIGGLLRGMEKGKGLIKIYFHTAMCCRIISDQKNSKTCGIEKFIRRDLKLNV